MVFSYRQMAKTVCNKLPRQQVAAGAAGHHQPEQAPAPVWEKPIQENPIQVKPMPDAPIQENPAQLNTKEQNKELSITQGSSPPTPRGKSRIGQDVEARELPGDHFREHVYARAYFRDEGLGEEYYLHCSRLREKDE